MACHDRYGLPLSTSSETAAQAYRDGVDLMFSAWPGAAEALDAAIAGDPDFALAYIARARHHFIYADVNAAHVDPLAHFLLWGAQEERQPVNDGHFG